MTIIDTVKAMQLLSGSTQPACSTVFGTKDWPSHFRAKRQSWCIRAELWTPAPESD